VPTNPFPFAFEYDQNGVNMHLKEVGEEMELTYGNQKSLSSQIGLSWLQNHGFPEYRSRIFQEANTKNFNDHFEDVYESVETEVGAGKDKLTKKKPAVDAHGMSSSDKATVPQCIFNMANVLMVRLIGQNETCDKAWYDMTWRHIS
jgi:hypothetical protein